MIIAVILPTMKLYGGVKRFLELGNVFVENGHECIIYSPEGTPPSWFPFQGKTAPLDDIQQGDPEVLITPCCDYIPYLVSSNAGRKVLYHIGQHEKLTAVRHHPEISIFVNSSYLYHYDRKHYGITPFPAFGGVAYTRFTPKKTDGDTAATTIVAYGRLNKKVKGTRFIIRACERLHRKGYPIRLVLFDSPVSDYARHLIETFSCGVPFEFIQNHPVCDMNDVFHRGDIFVSAEKKGGWANTCAEAMAAGLPVIATKIGTTDFLFHNETGLVVRRNSFSIERAIRRFIESPELRRRCAEEGRKRIARFDWYRLADTILAELQR